MELYITLGVFFSVLLLLLTMIAVVQRQRSISRNIAAVASGEFTASAKLGEHKLDKMLATEHEIVRHFFNVLRTASPGDLSFRLIRAGYFSPSAVRYFQTIRFLSSVGVIVGSWYSIRLFAPAIQNLSALVTAALIGGFVFILFSAFLDNRGRAKEIAYRKLFPDFMDLMIVCADAGLSIEAALDRVTREFLQTVPDFGVHLSIIGIEVRAGRPMHQAIANFADRVKVEEARILSVLFRQSEELGTSITQTLRTYSKEMRQTRIIKAEEKANKLPVKMIFPMAFFMFPVNLIIVVVPVLIGLLKMLTTMAPG